MKTNKLLAIIVLLILAMSCSQSSNPDEVLVTLNYIGTDEIEKMEFETESSSKTKISLSIKESIKKGETVKFTFSTKTLPKSDGSFRIKIKEKTRGKSRENQFGYYSNGVVFDESITIDIDDNEIKNKTKLRQL
jgi:hypothetical protein